MMESDLLAVLQAQCTRVFPDVAPQGTATPYITWQGIGGASLGYHDNSAASTKNVLMQINVWSTTRAASLSLIASIETAMRASAAFTAVPQGEPVNTYEPDTLLYGSKQRYLMWAAR